MLEIDRRLTRIGHRGDVGGGPGGAVAWPIATIFSDFYGVNQ